MEPARFRVVVGGAARRAHRLSAHGASSSVVMAPRLLTAAAIDRRLAREADDITANAGQVAVLVGRNVERWRRQRGMTQEELALAIRCNRSAVSRWEAGRRLPSLTHLLALGEALGCGAAALLPAGQEGAEEASGHGETRG